MEKKRIRAVHEQDLEELVKNLGLEDRIRAGDISCAICKNKIDLDNLGAIVPSGKTILLICEKDDCLKKALEKYGKGD